MFALLTVKYSGPFCSPLSRPLSGLNVLFFIPSMSLSTFQWRLKASQRFSQARGNSGTGQHCANPKATALPLNCTGQSCHLQRKSCSSSFLLFLFLQVMTQLLSPSRAGVETCTCRSCFSGHELSLCRAFLSPAL